MATPSGQISLSDVNAELNLSPTALITMNDAAVRTLAGVGGSGTVISMQDLQNKSNRVAIPLSITTNTPNYDVYANRGPTYAPGTSDITVTIGPAAIVFSSSTGTAAMSVPSSFNPGDTVTVVNNGVILGRGGGGGGGGSAGVGFAQPGGVGSGAGGAFLTQRAVTVNNLNRIAGGGGGGGGGGAAVGFDPDSGQWFPAPGGSGGSGIGGASLTAPTPGSPGSTSPVGNLGGAGGAGGTYGSSGSTGVPGTNAPTFGTGGSGGAGGYAINGNPFITYTNTGTRNGGIS
jgi:hypothetical protein